MSVPTLASNTVVLYKDPNWTSTKQTIDLAKVARAYPHKLPSNSLYDKATYVAWNLPVGTYLTLCDGLPNNEKEVHTTRTFDCIGTGKTETADLRNFNMNDCVASYIWEEYNTDLGYVEIFEHGNKTGLRVAIFLSKYPQNTAISMYEKKYKWWMENKISSIDWSHLGDICRIVFHDSYKESTGNGKVFSDAFGWNIEKENRNLRDIGCDNCLSVFQWSVKPPIAEEWSTAYFPVPQTEKVLRSYADENSGVNVFPTTIESVLSIRVEDAQSVEASCSNTSDYGWSTTVNVGYNPPDSAGGFFINCSFTAVTNYSNTTSTTTTTVTTWDIEVSDIVTIPARCTYYLKSLVQIKEIEPSAITLPGYRWYADQVSGSVYDPTKDAYKRAENLTISISGGIASTTNISTSYSPLDPEA